jgi:ATP-dependent DNA helicase RecG
MAERKAGKTKSEETLSIENQALSEASFADLDPERVASYLKLLTEAADERATLVGSSEEERLESLGLLRREANSLHPTIAALLLFARSPQRFLPHSSVKLARFKGRDVDGLIIDRQELFGPLDQIIEHAAGFVGRNMRVSSPIKGLYREDVPEYPLVAVREAITNALAHRDYANTGQKVMLRMFDDRLEVESPGGLVGPVTLENLGQKRYSRNPLLTRLMYEMRLVEEMGTGIRRIRRTLAELGSPAPNFFNDDTSFTAVLPARPMPTDLEKERAINPIPDRPVEIASPVSAPVAPTPPLASEPVFEINETNRAAYFDLLKKGLNERQARGLLYAQERGRLTNKDYRQVNPDITDETARLDLLGLVDKGYLMRFGDKKGASYLPR